MTQTEKLLSVAEVARYLGIPVATLYGWRYKGAGPPAIRVGRYLRYRLSSLERWLSEQERIQGRSA